MDDILTIFIKKGSFTEADNRRASLHSKGVSISL